MKFVRFGEVVVDADADGQSRLKCPNSPHEKHLVRASRSSAEPFMAPFLGRLFPRPLSPLALEPR